MTTADWIVMALYLVGLIALALYAGRGQRKASDYYLASRTLSPTSLALSTMATQCSTNSLLGAPAFVGFVAGGGLLWLQYELAVPIAMALLMLLMAPIRNSGVISVYEFLELRLGRSVRKTAAGTFLFFRAVATGVTVYGVSLVVTLLLDVNYHQAVLLLMAVTIAYDALGGMRAVVLSDVVQLLLIVAAILFALLIMGVPSAAEIDPQRLTALSFESGFSEPNGRRSTFAFWPMLFGGLFLYLSYYGCDQSQAQRILSSANRNDMNRVLLLNGLLRFPLVALYCLLGLSLAAFVAHNPDLLATLPLMSDGSPNYNLIFPVFVLEHFPPVLTGLVIIGIIAAAMSSIDSSLNALSASFVEDFLEDFLHAGGQMSEQAKLWSAKGATITWGALAVAFSYSVESIAPTVLEAVNKIGSMVNGPLLALFLIAWLAPGTSVVRVLAGFVAGVLANAILWLGFPEVSWLWWNPAGCLVSLLVCFVMFVPRGKPSDLARVASLGGNQETPESADSPESSTTGLSMSIALAYSAVIFLLALAVTQMR